MIQTARPKRKEACTGGKMARYLETADSFRGWGGFRVCRNGVFARALNTCPERQGWKPHAADTQPRHTHSAWLHGPNSFFPHSVCGGIFQTNLCTIPPDTLSRLLPRTYTSWHLQTRLSGTPTSTLVFLGHARVHLGPP